MRKVSNYGTIPYRTVLRYGVYGSETTLSSHTIEVASFLPSPHCQTTNYYYTIGVVLCYVVPIVKFWHKVWLSEE
eukprot:scaffold1813_cov160-Amphora_coffeaeformis.AAC.1